MAIIKKSFFLITCCLLTAILFFNLSPVYAINLTVEETNYLYKKSEIVFVSQTRYPPFEFVDTNKQHDGMMLDIIRWMALEIGFKPVFTDMTFQQAQEAVLSGKADILTSLFYSEKRKGKFEFTETIFDVPASIFVKTERTDIKSLKDLNSKTIAIQKGDYAKEYLESQRIEFKTFDTKDFGEATEMVISGKADAVIGDEQIVLYHMFSNRLTDRIKKVGEPLYTGKNCMASKKGNTILAGILKKGIDKARKSGLLDKISKKWLGTVYSQQESFLQRNFWALTFVIGGILLLTLWVWAWNTRLRTLVRKKLEDIIRSEEALRASENKYRALIEATNTGFVILDGNGKVLDANNEYAMLTGCQKKEDVLGRYVTEWTASHDIEKNIVAVDRCFKEGFIRNLEIDYIDNTGSITPIEINATVIETETGLKILSICRDISERKKIENKLQESEQMFRSIVENSYGGIFTSDNDFQFSYVNDKLCELSGYSREELLGMDFRQLVAEESLPIVADRYSRRRKGEDMPSWYAFTGVRKNGEKIVVETSSSVVTDSSGGKRTLGQLLDTTERKLAEEALRANRMHLMEIIDFLPDATLVIDKEKRIVIWNKAIERMTGILASEMIGKGGFAYTIPFYGEARPSLMDLIFEDSKEIEVRYPAINREGDTIIAEVFCNALYSNKGAWVFATASPLHDQSGNIVGAIESIRDITERKLAEEAMKEREKTLQAFFDAVHESLILINTEDIIMLSNTVGAQRLGKTIPEFVGTCLYNYFTPDVAMHRKEQYDKVIATGEPVYFQDTRSGRYFEQYGYPVFNEERKVSGVAIFAREITDRKKAEEALNKEKERFTILTENAPYGLALISQEGTFQYTNAKFKLIFGYDHKEIGNGKNWFRLAYPDKTYRHNVIAGWVNDVEKSVVGEFGSRVYTVRHKDGTEKEISFISVQLATGEKIMACDDVTYRKNLEAQLLQSQKMEAIGTLAGGIAHDINNILMGIEGYATLLLYEISPANPQYIKLKNIEKLVRSGSELTGQLLGFARGGKYEVKPTDINALIEKSADMFGRTKREVTILKNFEANLYNAEVDQGQIDQVLLNIFLNAWHAMPEGGELILTTNNIFFEESYDLQNSLKPGKFVKISITDTGIGIDKAIQKRIFEPFFTTKDMGRGSGLGLASVYGIIKNHGGTIEVSSEKGLGTTFTIYLPATEKEIKVTKHEKNLMQEGKEMILLVDDEEVILNVCKQMLEALGYRVLVAKEGQEAIELYTHQKEKIDLVILDMIMPGLSGGAIYNSLKGINPKIKVILASGYSINGQASQILERGCNGFIQKPFDITMLSQKIREVLRD